MVSGVARVWKRVGQLQPLAERWQAGIDELSKLSGELFPGPPSETRFDDLMQRLAELRNARQQQQPSPEVISAGREIYEYMKQWDQYAREIQAAQNWLRYARSDWRHKLLKDISPDCFSIPGLYHVTDVDNLPTFASVPEVRQAAKEMLPRLEWVREVLAKITEARRFDSLGPERQALALAKALYDSQSAINNRLEAVEAENAALQARLDKLERRNKKAA